MRGAHVGFGVGVCAGQQQQLRRLTMPAQARGEQRRPPFSAAAARVRARTQQHVHALSSVASQLLPVLIPKSNLDWDLIQHLSAPLL